MLQQEAGRARLEHDSRSMARRHEIDTLRRSVAMLTPGQPSGLEREQYIQLLAELRAVTFRLDALKRRLRELAEDG